MNLDELIDTYIDTTDSTEEKRKNNNFISDDDPCFQLAVRDFDMSALSGPVVATSPSHQL